MSAAPLLHDNLKFTLEVLKGPHAGETFESEKGAITIGRGPENDLVLTNDPRVSRQHIEIKQSLGQFYIVNMSQKNFVLLDGQNINSEKLDSKSVFQVGDSEIRFLVQGSTNLLEPVAPQSNSLPFVPPPMPKAGEGVPPDVASASPLQVAPQPTPVMQSQPMPGSAPPTHWQGAAPSMRPSYAPAHGGMSANVGTYGGPFQQPSYTPGGPGAGSDGAKKKFFYIIGGIVVLLMLSVMFGTKGTQKNVETKAFRTTEELELARRESEDITKSFQERRDKMNQALFQRAHENFLRGYRDYRQGQYLRAKEAFQLVLNLDPDNDLARRYLNLTQIRFDELVKHHALQGRKYRERQNYRLCRAHMQTVMTLLGADPTNREYQEARQMHRECTVAVEARY